MLKKAGRPEEGLSAIPRYFDLWKLLENSSHFLLGPRATGKSSLVKEMCREGRGQLGYINLADSKTYLHLKRDPFLLASLVDTGKDLIAIDEIQRIPELLNEVHRMIEDQSKRFLLIGDSTQKLKLGSAGLLDDLAPRVQFLPLSWSELSKARRFDLDRYLLLGGLPQAYLGKSGDDYLYNYVDRYIQEEIYTETPTRNLSSFIQFLEYAANSNGGVLDVEAIAREAKLPVGTVRDYYQILQDTLMGFLLTSWPGKKGKGNGPGARFYFFDLGVVHTLLGTRELHLESELYRHSLKHLMACELRSYCHYKKIRIPLQFWQPEPQILVDFIVAGEWAIQVVPTRQIAKRDIQGILEIGGWGRWRHLIVVSLDPQERPLGKGIRHFHWENFLHHLWRDRFNSL